MYKVYGYWEVEHSDFPTMEYYITTRTVAIEGEILMGEYPTETEAKEKIIALRKGE